MKYIGISILIIIDLMILFFSFLLSPYEFPEDKKLGIIDDEAVEILLITFSISIFINGLLFMKRLTNHIENKKMKMLRWKVDYLILAMLVFSIIEVIRMLHFQSLPNY